MRSRPWLLVEAWDESWGGARAVTRRTGQGQEASVKSALRRTTTRGMKLISWNVNGRVADAGRKQIEAVLGREPDVVALQELTVASYPQWCEALLTLGSRS